MVPTLNSIFEAVSLASGIPVAAIRGRRKTQAVAYARFVIVYLVRQAFPWWSLAELAAAIGRSDHGTALHALGRARALQHRDRTFAELLARAQAGLQAKRIAD